MPILTQENEPKIGAVHDNQPQAANFEIEDDHKPKELGQNRISVT